MLLGWELKKRSIMLFRVLSDGGVIIASVGEVPWSKCCATLIDKYGVCWWISIEQFEIAEVLLWN